MIRVVDDARERYEQRERVCMCTRMHTCTWTHNTIDSFQKFQKKSPKFTFHSKISSLHILAAAAAASYLVSY